MTVEAGPRRIGRTTRMLHWGSAILLVGAFSLAWTFSALGPGGLSARLVGIHRSLGLAILVLTVLRLIWRGTVASLPPLPAGTATWERRLARGVQGALYLSLLAMPLLGWMGSSAEGDAVVAFGMLPLPDLVGANQDLSDLVFQAHHLVGYAILGLLALHIAGALRHHLVTRDDVLASMAMGLSIPATRTRRD